MGLLEKIDEEYKVAFKAHHQAKVNALRLMKSAVKNAAIEARHDLTDAEIIQVMTKEAKRRRESIEMFAKAGRADLVAQEQAELTELEVYLPAQLDDAGLEKIVQAVITTLSPTPKDFGKVMQAVMAQVAGQADGGRVSAAVKRLLK